MLNSKNTRELAYLVRIDDIKPIQGRDKVECAVVGGWTVMVRKECFKPGDLGVYFEIDSKCPEKEPFLFLAQRHFKIKTQKYAIKDEEGNKVGQFWSQGLLMPLSDFVIDGVTPEWLIELQKCSSEEVLSSDKRFLTETLQIVYAEADDNRRKSASNKSKYDRMAQRMGKKFSKQPYRWLMQREWGKRLLYLFFGNNKKDVSKEWPVGKFPGVSKTDQERVENMTWILNDKTPFIVTQKCDGSSGTYILEKKGKNRYEFYVCSRNVRMKDEDQECFYGSHNYYWEAAKLYLIEEKMKKWLDDNPDREWVCWQGEICAPGIQKNPHKLEKTHFYAFHWTDNINGRLDIREAQRLWKGMNIEVVPIVDTAYILPDSLDELKEAADGFYNAEVCEGHTDCKREGYVYYKITDPTFSFKNVSREYLLKN